MWLGDYSSIFVLNHIVPPQSLLAQQHVLDISQSESNSDRLMVTTGTTSNGKPQKGPLYSVNGFPDIISTYAATRRRSVEIYTRGLLLEGHGYPVFHPYGILDPPDISMLKSVTVGDVGVIGADGQIDWLFNIFLPADRPTQICLPREFQPFDPAPDESDILFIANYHAPGTIITSPGVNVNVRSKEPWDVTFTSAENQAAMLILQGGADRYDLKSTNRYHEYIAKHAQHWYQVANDYGEVTHPNGSLLVVTGYDSCQRFSHAQFAPEPMHFTMNMKFKQDLGDMPGDWISKGHNHTVGWPYPEGSNMTALDAPLTVFIRGLRISLNGSTWRSILPSTGFLPRNKHCTLVANKASKKQLWLEKTMGRLGIGLTEEETLQDVFSVHESTFQPNYILGQILLGQFPDASTVLLEDRIWCSFVEKGCPCTLQEINKLISRLLMACHIVEHQGTIKLVPKKGDQSRQIFPGEEILTPPPSWSRRQLDEDWVRHTPLKKWV